MHGREQALSSRWKAPAKVLLGLTLWASCAFAQAQEPAASEDAERLAKIEFFEKSVRPLLLNKCGQCHGEKKQWGGLRVDSRAALQKGGETGAALTPGQPGDSLLMTAVRRQDGLEMPPEEPLSPSEIDILEQWIQAGAVWPEETKPVNTIADAARTHWAFQPVAAVTPPTLNDGWCQTPIDQFVLQKLRDKGLTPAPKADARTLIRRLAYDLTGLPPTPEDVAAFISDDSSAAYAQLVEKYLASPHYGEQWARHWLDVARYSDTKGYVYAREERFLVQSATYRDWVVAAFQRDLPYHQFVVQQIAADQEPDGAPENLAAMGFLTIGRRFLGVTHDIYDDRIDVVTRGLMGLTVSCARCHDHKYDPIPTADYYSLYGVFQNCTERLVPIGKPDTTVAGYAAFDEELKKRQNLLQEKLLASRATASQRARDRVTDYLTAQLELEKYPEEGFDQILAPTDLVPTLVRRWQAFLKRAAEDNDTLFAAWRLFEAIPAEQFAALAADVSRTIQQEAGKTVAPLVAAQFETPPASLREVAERYGALLTGIHQEWQKTLQTSSTAAGTPLPASFEDPDKESLRQVLYGPLSPCEVPDEPIVTTEYFFDSGTVTELWRLQGEVDRWLIQSPLAPPFSVAVNDRELITEPRIFRRGNPATRGATVPRQFLEVVAKDDRQPFQKGSGRWELAQAIVDPANPLTARVWVNRVWMHHFGAGLVTTPSDFGVRAMPPSHPELLDWLAKTFVEQGWRTKDLHRQILLSATYQQESRIDDPATLKTAMEIDPQNRLLWRMNPRRLGFEELRDSYLAVSGDLDPQAGGRATDLFKGDHRRRTIYGLIDRQFLPGVLRMFDFANPDLHTPQRSETTVPQQALFLMNHPFLGDRAKSLAAQQTEAPPAQRVEQLFLKIYQRRPTSEQLAAALAYVAAAEEEPLPAVAVESLAWQYGFGAIDPDARQLKSFQLLPHFTGTAWQGGMSWPDAALGWVQLTAQGGHPGNTLEHAVVRRWTSPFVGTVSLTSTLNHEPPAGDGIRYWVISSRGGTLATGLVHHRQETITLPAIAVETGETLDFVVDIGGNLNSDQFLWPVTLQRGSSATESETPQQWNSQRDFQGPPVTRLDPWAQLAQVLLLANEFAFVD